jgi:hypothetical protein
MAVIPMRVLWLSCIAMFALCALPAQSTIVPSFHHKVNLPRGDSAILTSLACPYASGRATSVEAWSNTKGAATADTADVTCATETTIASFPVIARTDCDLVKGKWTCEAPTRYVAYADGPLSVYMPIGSLAEAPSAITLSKYLLKLGRFQGVNIGENVNGAWCVVGNAPLGDLMVRCGDAEMIVTNDGSKVNPKYRVFEAGPGPIP